MKYKFKKRLISEFATYIVQKNPIILKVTAILAVQNSLVVFIDYIKC